ncbi:MAG TPA: carboxymuconolactone decarboxylase [Acidimicrobiaceae bacterium]|jgi:4-carboxymuconolactone decarboxylase|nr:carboxymuconolactone decarboxylase [Acidimicrobiaceae bacterium]
MTESPEISPKRQAGLNMMNEVYGFEVGDAPGDFLGYTIEHLFGDIWQREGLDIRDRRLLLIGLLVGSGLNDVLDVQLPAALDRGELTEEQLREIVILFAHYAGWPTGAKLNSQVEALIARRAKARAAEERAADESNAEG